MTEPGEYTPGHFTGGEASSFLATCKGSFALGTACGRCSRCKEEMARMKPKFKVKAETLGSDVIATFRVRPEVHEKIKSMSDQSGISMADVVRQMIDFALENS